jgi:hypothetical protein
MARWLSTHSDTFQTDNGTAHCPVLYLFGADGKVAKATRKLR